MTPARRTLVSVSTQAVSESTPPVGAVEHVNATGEHTETFTTDRAAWSRYDALMDEMGMRRI